MDKDEIINHRQTRMKLWADVWSATCSANDCKSPSTATKFADEALKAFDDRFPIQKQESVVG